MTSGFFREEEVYQLGKIADMLGETMQCTKNLLDELEQFGVVKTQGPFSYLESEKRYKFVFVGVAVAGEHVFRCCPKYMTINESALENLKLILKVIRQYKKRKEQHFHLQSEGQGKVFSKLETGLYFLEDYFESGFYENEQEWAALNGEGEILWDQTIDQLDAYVKGGRPYYLDFYTKETQKDEEEYIRRLHETILFLCTKELEKAGLLELLDIPRPDFQERDLNEFGDMETICYHLGQEMKVQFITRKQKLLQTMYEYILQESMKETEGYCLFGTDRFAYVWEDVCKVVLGNVLQKQLKDLPGTLCASYEKQREKTLQELIERPVWIDALKGIRAYAETLRPDAIAIYEAEEIWNVAIMDAKYYQICFKNDHGKETVQGQPGVGDITKQYLYLLALKDFILAQGYKRVHNLFLCPSETEETLHVGDVQMEMLGNVVEIGTGKIEVKNLPAKELYQLYLKGKQTKNPKKYLG